MPRSKVCAHYLPPHNSHLFQAEGNFLVPKLCRFKNIVPFYKIGPVGRARQAQKNGQNKAKFAASEIYCRFGL